MGFIYIVDNGFRFSLKRNVKHDAFLEIKGNLTDSIPVDPLLQSRLFLRTFDLLIPHRMTYTIYIGGKKFEFLNGKSEITISRVRGGVNLLSR